MGDAEWPARYPRVFRALFMGWDAMDAPARGPARPRKPLVPVPGPSQPDDFADAPEGPQMPQTLLTSWPAPSCAASPSP